MRGLCTEGNLHFKINWASLIVTIFALFYFVFGAIFHIQAPKGLYLEGRFNKGFFCVTTLGAYLWTWRGLLLEFYVLTGQGLNVNFNGTLYKNTCDERV